MCPGQHVPVLKDQLIPDYFTRSEQIS